MDANLSISLANLLVLVFAVGGFSYRLGSMNTTVKRTDERLGKLDETNGGGFARCTQHNEQLQELERRQVEHAEEMKRRWDAFQERVGSKES